MNDPAERAFRCLAMLAVLLMSVRAIATEPGEQRLTSDPAGSMYSNTTCNRPECLISQNACELIMDANPWDDYFQDLFRGGIAIYNTALQPGISSGCPSIPSCSEYMTQAISELGLPMGLIIGLERLLHESGELHHGVVIKTNEGPRVVDPVENNTFWWRY